MSSSLSPKIIEEMILKNYTEYISLFGEFQSNFFSSLNKKYQNLDSGQLVLYFERNSHQSILRKKDYDLNFDLSFDKFWQNHSESKIEQTTIMNISKNTLLPKETARRKILDLVKQKIINKKSNYIAWLPNEQYKQNYNEFIGNEITQISKLVKYISRKINLSFYQIDVENEFKNKFSFYWFHYLDTQLKYMNLWKKYFKDIEIIFILLQISTVVASRTKLDNISSTNIFKNYKIISDKLGVDSISVSAASISDITGLPRATCIRKLNALNELKIVTQNNITKRYSLGPGAIAINSATHKIALDVVKVYSEFYFICIRMLTAKSAN